MWSSKPKPGDIRQCVSPDSFEAAHSDGWWYEQFGEDGKWHTRFDKANASKEYQTQQDNKMRELNDRIYNRSKRW